jgi:hypothetical protein
LGDGLSSDYSDHDIIDFFYLVKNDKLLANTAIAKKITEYLQLLKSEKNFAEVSLEEIKRIYELLLECHPYDVSLYEGFFYYLRDVLDKSADAELFFVNGIKKLEEKINELKREIAE